MFYEVLTEAGVIPEAATQEEPEAEGTDNVEVVAYSSPSSPSSSSSETKESTPSAPRRSGKGLMRLGGLLDAKAIAPEALRPTTFEPSTGEVSDAKKMFGTFVLPELEIPLAQKSTSELLDASDVAIAKVYRLFSYIIILGILLTCIRCCRFCFYRGLSTSRLRNPKPWPEAHMRILTCCKNGQRKLKAKNASCRGKRRMLNCDWNSLKGSLAPFARRSRLPIAK